MSDKKSFFRLEGKVALVTGASSGLGAHFARILAEAGSDVAIAARRLDRVEELAHSLSGYGARVLPVEMDVTDQESCERGIAASKKELGPTTILVNNAGIADPKTFLEASDDHWDQIIETNLTSVRRIAQLIARQMVDAETVGSIINIASVLGMRAFSHQSSYAASKAGVIHLTRSMAIELFQFGVRVNAICPGYFRTEMNDDYFDTEAGIKYISRTPPRRLGNLDELTSPLLMLADDSSSFINGAAIPVDGGHSVGLI